MKTKAAMLIMVLALPVLVVTGHAQVSPNPAESPATAPDGTVETNIREYVELLRSNVRQRKAEVMAAMMQLSAADAAKFWPIYNQYDAELDKLNDLRVANIEEYARTYTQLSDEKADELIKNALTERRQRSELLAKYYERVKQPLGAITAARFVQVEDQLLLLIDLQIDSALPIVGHPEEKVAIGVAQ